MLRDIDPWTRSSDSKWITSCHRLEALLIRSSASIDRYMAMVCLLRSRILCTSRFVYFNYLHPSRETVFILLLLLGLFVCYSISCGCMVMKVLWGYVGLRTRNRLWDDLLSDLHIDLLSTISVYIHRVAQKTGPPAILSYCKYSENSTTELHEHWWTSAVLYAEHSH